MPRKSTVPNRSRSLYSHLLSAKCSTEYQFDRLYLIVWHDIAWKPTASAIAQNQFRNDVPTHCLPCIYGMYVHFLRHNRKHSIVRTPWSACASHTLAGCHVSDMRRGRLTSGSGLLSRSHHRCSRYQSVPQSARPQDDGNLRPTLIIASCSESVIEYRTNRSIRNLLAVAFGYNLGQLIR
jgi:hypothetical protein